jgi:pimeloyl-ACP methyl ester carboxylesterase
MLRLRHRLAARALLALVLAACGSARSHHLRPATIDGCVRLGSGAAAVTLHPRGAPPVAGVLVGPSRTTTFVLSNESDENLCSWLPFVRALTRRGYSALLYDYLAPTDLPADASAGVVAARTAGARHVVLMGASVGARASIEAAAGDDTRSSAVVSLSAERTVRLDPTDLLGVAPRVAAPTLLISARDDPFVDGATRRLLAALGARDKRALILPGADHGTALLTDGTGARVRATILAFVAAAR